MIPHAIIARDAQMEPGQYRKQNSKIIRYKPIKKLHQNEVLS